MVAVIHYCWFGGAKPDCVLRCIESWRKCFPGFQIREWNESNSGCESSDYFRRAIAAKQWAFAADYVRLKKLGEYGGVYLDTDIEAKVPMAKELGKSPVSLGFEKNCVQACLIVCPPHHRLIKKLLSAYDADIDVELQNREPKSIVTRLTDLLIDEYGLRTPFGEQRLRDGIRILPANRLLVDMQDGQNLAIHHYAVSWKKNFDAEAFVCDVRRYCDWSHAPVAFRLKERLKMFLQYRLPWVYRIVRDRRIGRSK